MTPKLRVVKVVESVINFGEHRQKESASLIREKEKSRARSGSKKEKKILDCFLSKCYLLVFHQGRANFFRGDHITGWFVPLY